MSNDHFVSKTYLKWFENPISNKLYCSSYLENKRKWTRPKLKDAAQICYQKNRFLPDVEQDFNKKFESKWNPLIGHLNQFPFPKLKKKHFKKNKILNSEQVSIILDFIITHYKRSLKVQKANKIQVEETLVEVEKQQGQPLSEQEKENLHKAVDNSFVKAPQESKKIWKRKPWLLSVNTTEVPFITSSKPVLWHDEIHRIGVYAPLSPQFAIFIVLHKFKEKSGLIVEQVTKENAVRFNQLMRERVEEDSAPIIISNKQEILAELLNIA